MKITNIKATPFNVPLKQPFTISLGTTEEINNVFIEIETDDGSLGYGESAPMPLVTGETQQSIIYTIENYFKPMLLEEDPLNIERIHDIMDGVITGNSGAKAGVDIALHDLVGRVYQEPLYKVLGGHSPYFESDVTVGIDEPDIMVQEAKTIADEGFSAVKVKVGLDYKKDIERIISIREAVGNDIKIRLDANQGWNPKEAIFVIKELEQYDIELVEQPTLAHDIEGMSFIRKNVNLPIMADESVFSPEDTIRIIKAGAADYINIKLMKSGGLFKAKQICHIAEAANIECMIGCMLESPIAITAAAHLMASCKNITKADLDAPLFLKVNPVEGGSALKAGANRLDEDYGLGIQAFHKLSI